MTAQCGSLVVMMGIQEDWAMLRARIVAVVEAADIVTELRDIPPTFVELSVVLIKDDCVRLWSEIDSFLSTHVANLPPATDQLREKWQKQSALIPKETATATPVKVTIAWMLLLASIKGNIDWLLADSEAAWRSTTERAFEHLQRTIVVDPDAMQRWKDAFDDNEPACERLGAIHLLWHGIWGFKVHAEGERTDLVLGELIDAATIERAARAGTALVLTEWKRVTGQLSVDAAKNDIERQVRRYRRGSLSGVELKRTCYGVLVSQKYLSLSALSERALPDFTLRFVNVVVDPDTPSVRPAVRLRAEGLSRPRTRRARRKYRATHPRYGAGPSGRRRRAGQERRGTSLGDGVPQIG